MNQGIEEVGILYNYKEPLRKFKEGFGYLGAVTYSKDGQRIQCHFCGKFFQALGTHISFFHELTGPEYKEQTQLMAKTALVGEVLRENRMKWIKDNMHIVSDNLLAQANKMKGKKIEKRRKGTQYSLERRNIQGSCPDQLLDKILHLKKKLKRIPSQEDFLQEHDNKYFSAIITTFGTWTNALSKLNMTSLSQERKDQFTHSRLISYLKDFYQMHNRTPQYSDFRRGLLPSKTAYYNAFGSLNEARYQARIPLMIRGNYIGFFQYRQISYNKVKREGNTFVEK